MELHKIDHETINLVQQSMGIWNTPLTSGSKHLANIKIKRGIFQADALSPLLFCVAINPLSYILRDAKQGYTLKTGHKLNHLFYMDDLKLYVKNKKDLTALNEAVRIFTTDIYFGLEKCARQIIQRGNIEITDGLNLDTGKIKDTNIETGYKYLGILQNMQNKQKEVERKVTTNYRKRSRQILKSHLNAKNKYRPSTHMQCQ